MIWRMLFIFGGLLVSVTTLVSTIRINGVDDAMSLAVATSSSNGNRIVRVDLDGTQTPLFNLPLRSRLLRYEWSPDGQWLLVSIYYFRGSNTGEIYLVHRSGLEVELVKRVSYLEWGARFSPDGREIAFITYGVPKLQTRLAQQQEVIQVVRLNTEGTELGRYEIISPVERESVWTLTWLDNDTLEITEAPETNIHQVHIPSHTLTSTHIETTGSDFYYRFYRLSPNRKWYIQHSHHANLERFPAYAETDSVVVLNLPHADIQYAAWSDDSEWLALWVYPESDDAPSPRTPNIYLLRYDGSQLRQLTQPQTTTKILPLVHESAARLQNNQRPFSPQNHWLVYAVRDQADMQTYFKIQRTDGSGQETKHLLASKLAGYSFQWSPYIPVKFHMWSLIWEGLVALWMASGWQYWQRRQNTPDNRSYNLPAL